MKTISLICCILLAFLLFSSPSIMARDLAAHDDHEADVHAGHNGGRSGDPDKPLICGMPSDNPAYSKCIAKQKPIIKCEPKNVFGRCKPPQGRP